MAFNFFCFSFAATSQQVNDRTWSTSMLMLAAFYVLRTAGIQLYGFNDGFSEVKKRCACQVIQVATFSSLVEGHQQHLLISGHVFNNPLKKAPAELPGGGSSLFFLKDFNPKRMLNDSSNKKDLWHFSPKIKHGRFWGKH